jgi:hypothetical protein
MMPRVHKVARQLLLIGSVVAMLASAWQLRDVAAATTAGLKVGVSAADQNVTLASFDEPTRSRIGISLAVYLERECSRHVDLLAELHYVQRGMKDHSFQTTPTGQECSGWLSNRLDYLCVPVLLKYAVGSWEVCPFVALGPRLDIRLGSRCQSSACGETLWGEIYDEFNRLDLGADAVVGLETAWFSIEGRYNYSLGPSFEEGDSRVRNVSFEILLGRKL